MIWLYYFSQFYLQMKLTHTVISPQKFSSNLEKKSNPPICSTSSAGWIYDTLRNNNTQVYSTTEFNCFMV